jgi:hypothetical protein
MIYKLQNFPAKFIREYAWIGVLLYLFQMSSEAAEFAMTKWRKLIDQLEAQSTRTKANSKKRLTSRGVFVYVDRRRYVEVKQDCFGLYSFLKFQAKLVKEPGAQVNDKQSWFSRKID